VNLQVSLSFGCTEVGVELQKQLNPFRICEHVRLDPKQPEMINKIQAWMSDCMSKHRQCARGRISSPSLDEDFVPSRLIKLDMDQISIIRLISPTTPVRFAALSYC
jgi:hypothetical protein